MSRPLASVTEAPESIEAMLQVSSLLFDQLAYAISVHDSAGRLVYCNSAMLNAFGKISQEALCQALAHDPLAEFQSGIQRCISLGQPEHLRLHFDEQALQRLPNNQFSCFPIKNKQQQLIGVLAYNHSVEFVRQAYLQNTRTQRAYLRTLLDNLPYPIWMKNIDGMFLAVNRQFCDDFGYLHPRDVLGKYDRDLFDQPMAETHRQDDMHVIATGEEKRLVEKITRADGTSYWGYSHLTPVKNDEGVLGTVGFTVDISEERRLNSELSQLEKEYALLLNNLPIAIIVYDKACKRVLMNQFFTEIIRMDRHSVENKAPGEAWSPFIRNMDAATYERHLRQVMFSQQQQNFELILEQENLRLNVYDVRLIPRHNRRNATVGVVAIVQDITDRHQSQIRMHYEARHDALTGLPNRTLLNEHLQRVLLDAERAQQTVAVMVLDLDGFKAINDSLGHTYGDLLLKEMTRRLRQSGNQTHFCARMGGDEFAVVLEHVQDKQDAQTLADNILQDVLKMYRIEQAECFVSASVGIALYPNDSHQPQELLKFADIAMYAAKESGRNNSCFYQPSLTKRFERQFHLSNALRLPNTQHEISLVYQPIMNILNQEMVGVEALCRWHSKTLGSVPPMEFIQTAEQTGLIMSLGMQMMRQAFQAATRLNKHAQKIIKVSLNISARQFSDPTLIEQINVLLEETGCQPEWVKFEITETVLLEYSQEILLKLNRLNQMGITIVLDDFGTGYASLSYLLKFPLQQIKIDRSFIQDIEVNPNSAKLVKAVIGLVNTMGKELVAEGIETNQQANLMKAYGCHMVQGFLYSKALPLPELLAFAERGA